MQNILDQSIVKWIRKESEKAETVHRAVIPISADALHAAKRAIFALHRGDQKKAEELLANAKSLLQQIEKKGTQALVQSEGSYRAAVEEYVEAALFFQFLKKGMIGAIPNLTIPYESYLAGMSDVVGEILRYVVNEASDQKKEEVQKGKRMAEAIVGVLVDMNLTGYLRTKFDQAKQSLRKIEYIAFELALQKITHEADE